MKANVFTPINLIIGTLLVLILVAEAPGDALFAGVVVSNSIVGIVQELRAKRTLDKLAVLNAPRARVVRDGTESDIDVNEVVEDDLLALGPGDQVVVDGAVVDEHGIELNESLLTGESEPVSKDPGDEVMSGSFVSAGSGHYVATKVGAAAYATMLAEEARRFKLAGSELRTGINLILRWLTWIIPPVSLLLLFSLLDAEDKWREALRGTVAAAVAMVPDGLVLLTSIAFIVGVLALAKNQALAKELASVELLARVDVLCLDKTGTITTGEIEFADIDALATGDRARAEVALANLAVADPSPNATLEAIGERFGAPSKPWTVTDLVPFSSARKWASTTFAEEGTWYLGAPEILVGPDDPTTQVVARHAEEGRRVVLLATGDQPDGNEHNATSPWALVLLEDEVREDAPEILRFFVEQGITLRVISGDHPTTVAAVARRAGVPDATEGIDARTLPDDEDQLADVLEANAVFGRVTPHQKRAMVGALQSRQHVVAMTGDGVNDVLALKDADMGIAMGAGSSATRAVAQLTLLDNRFSTLPVALAEGRRVINNIERVANLFVVKASYAVLLALFVGLWRVPFMFLPRHLTLIGTFSIGVPGFFLALSPNARRAVPGFVRRVIRFSLPAGAVAAVLTFVVYEFLLRHDEIPLDEARTGATLVLLGIGLIVLGLLARPLTKERTLLIVVMFLSYLVALNVKFISDYFQLVMPATWTWWLIGFAVAVGALILIIGPRFIPWWNEGVAAQALPRQDVAAATVGDRAEADSG